MPVPLLDLRAQHATIRDDVVAAMLEVVDAQAFILGEPVAKLECELAGLSHTRYAVGCANGTDALLLALRAVDVGAGDEVVTTPFTFFATAGTIHNVGATPVFVDIDPATFNVAPDAIAAAIGPRTKAVMPVDLFGQMAPIEQVQAVARGLPVIEDAAQSIGARRAIDGEWRLAGEAATIGTFSFFPSKNLGGYGDGGMMVTQDEALFKRLLRLRTHGSVKTYYHEEVGYNSRLDALQAAVLRAKPPDAVCGSGERVDLQPVHRARRAARRAAGAPQGAGDRQLDLLPAAAPPAAVLRLSRLSRGAVPRGRARRRRGAVAADLPRADAGAARRGDRRRARVLRALSRPGPRPSAAGPLPVETFQT
jgi:hypothetical protein